MPVMVRNLVVSFGNLICFHYQLDGLAVSVCAIQNTPYIYICMYSCMDIKRPC